MEIMHQVSSMASVQLSALMLKACVQNKCNYPSDNMDLRSLLAFITRFFRFALRALLRQPKSS